MQSFYGQGRGEVRHSLGRPDVGRRHFVLEVLLIRLEHRTHIWLQECEGKLAIFVNCDSHSRIVLERAARWATAGCLLSHPAIQHLVRLRSF
jgi:hypothetical protein